MKTSFTRAYCLRQHRPTYLYHGIPMQCFAPFQPGYFKGYDLTPIPPPYNYDYECDGLPITATPPITHTSVRCGTAWASGGILYFQNVLTGVIATCNYEGYWIYSAPSEIEFAVSFPIHYIEGENAGTVGFTVSLPETNGLNFQASQTWAVSGGHKYLSQSFLRISLASTVYYYGSYVDAWAGKLIKNPTTGKWDIYLNDVLITSGISLSPNTLAFYLSTRAKTYCLAGMDYLRANITF